MLRRKTKENLLIALLIVGFVALQFLTMYMDRMHNSSLNGVFSAFQYGICLLLIFINRKKGIISSMILMGISILIMARVIIFGRVLAPLPGLVNMVLYVITIIIIANFHRKREAENISDYLTGALNRRGLYKKLTNSIADRENFSVVYFSITNFRDINDNYGHMYGDELLRKITKRISQKIKKEDSVARINGCDYVVILKNEADAGQIASVLLNSIKEKAVLVLNKMSVECYPECYGGLVSTLDMETVDAETLIKCADVATCEAIEQKSIELVVFNSKMLDKLNRQLEIEMLIKEGLQKDYFYMVYQPQYKLEGKKLRGFESLIRMKLPDGTIVSPGEFIPVAERSDLVLQIDDYVLRRILKEGAGLIQDNPTLTISANVSAKNIGSIEFVDKIKLLLDTYMFPAKNLEIEITEYCMVESMDITISNIKRLRAMGIQIALDDFGTGYTSLNYVAKMPINLLKIDKSLIDDLATDEKIQEFVQAVITMGHVMGCEVISEGVEDEEQLKYLGDNGCDFIQGFVWGKPLEYDVARELSLNKR